MALMSFKSLELVTRDVVETTDGDLLIIETRRGHGTTLKATYYPTLTDP